MNILVSKCGLHFLAILSILVKEIGTEGGNICSKALAEMEQPKAKYLISGLSEKTDAAAIVGLFGRVGKIKIFEQIDGNNVFVTYADPAIAPEAVYQFNGNAIDGNTINVEMADHVHDIRTDVGSGGQGGKGGSGWFGFLKGQDGQPGGSGPNAQGGEGGKGGGFFGGKGGDGGSGGGSGGQGGKGCFGFCKGQDGQPGGTGQIHKA